MRLERSDIHIYIKMRTYTNDLNQDLLKRAQLQIQTTVNNTEVTVNTCTCTDVFTIITKKDQSGGIYNNCIISMAVVNKPCLRAQSVYCYESLATVL